MASKKKGNSAPTANTKKAAPVADENPTQESADTPAAESPTEEAGGAENPSSSPAGADAPVTEPVEADPSAAPTAEPGTEPTSAEPSNTRHRLQHLEQEFVQYLETLEHAVASDIHAFSRTVLTWVSNKLEHG